ncbi:MAG TPA: tetratricopeptide repeat protein [Phycisphaerae bacterium]|nr:tetratricopeptide repeat protein [Phycisphaerae bacterium]
MRKKGWIIFLSCVVVIVIGDIIFLAYDAAKSRSLNYVAQIIIIPSPPPPTELMTAANSGSADAEYQLANFYYTNYESHEAFIWFQKAAKQGNSSAEIKLGYMYLHGRGTEVDVTQAYSWFQKAMKQDDPAANNALGDYYYNRGNFYFGKNRVLAFIYFQKSAAIGNAEGEFWLGFDYMNGWGIKQNYAQAIAWLQKAADQDNLDSESVLASLLWNEHDYVQAIKWFQKLAAQGNMSGDLMLGYAYKDGQGVQQNYNMAIKCFQAAAEMDEPQSMSALAELYYHGDGVEKDYAKAFYWYQKAAEQNNTDAEYMLGNMYLNGRGVQQDYTQAMQWYQKAASQGDAYSCRDISKMYQLGLGVAPDSSEAEYWANRAQQLGLPSSGKIIIKRKVPWYMNGYSDQQP